jgi:integrase
MARRAGIWWRSGVNAWYVKINGKQVRLAPDKKEAERQFHRLKAQEPEKPILTSPLLACEVCDRFLVWCRAHREKRTAEAYKYFIQRFFRWLPRGKDMMVAELKPYHVVEYMDSGDWGNSYKRNVAGAVQRAFKWAVAVGLIDIHPCTFIPKPKGGRRETPMSEAEYGLILQNSDKHFCDVVEFAWETGCRVVEIRTMRPEYVLGDRVVFPVAKSKGKRRARIILLNDKAKAILERRLKMGREWVFTNRSGRQWTAYAISCRFSRLVETLGRKVCLTEARHAYATRKLLEGHSVEIVAAVMGHASPQMVHAVYGHLDRETEHLRRAL